MYFFPACAQQRPPVTGGPAVVIRPDFLVMEEPVIYLDNAATTWPKPRQILDQMVRIFAETGVSPGRGNYDAATTASDFIQRTRQKFARFFGAPDADRVIFTANATDSLNIALLGILKPGDHVITTRLEHNSVLRPLHHLQKKGDITCSVVSFDQQGFIDPDDIKKAVRPETRLVVMTHASNVLGTIQPVNEVGAVCEAHGIDLVVDASQSAGQVPVDMKKMNASALVFTGHKSLYGPPGIGGLILHPEIEINATRFGGTGIHSASLNHTRDFPHRLEAGTHNLMGIIGLSLALDYLLKTGIASIHKQEMKIIQRLYDGFSNISGVRFYGAADLNPSRHLALLSLNLESINPADLGAVLDGDFDIAVRVGLHCAPLVHDTLGTHRKGAVRFSPGLFTTCAEIDTTVTAMEQIAGLI